MDVFDRIRQDHDVLRQRFEEMHDAVERGDAERSRALFSAQYELLIAHHQTEEEVVFSKLVRNVATRAIAEEAWEEHRALNAYLTYLKDAPDKIRPAAKVKVLHESVTHHIEEEEREMFRLGRAAFSADVLEGLVMPFEQKEERRLFRLRQASA